MATWAETPKMPGDRCHLQLPTFTPTVAEDVHYHLQSRCKKVVEMAEIDEYQTSVEQMVQLTSKAIFLKNLL